MAGGTLQGRGMAHQTLRLPRTLHWDYAWGPMVVMGGAVFYERGVLLDPRDPSLHSERTQGIAADPVYGRANCLPMLGVIKTSRT